MFTVGREREKEHARNFLRESSDSSKLEAVIDAVHDLLDGKAVIDSAKTVFVLGFVDGGAGTWESTGSWLAKTAKEFPALMDLWRDFALHRSAKVRFRAAAFVDRMPEDCAMSVFPLLLADPSAKVRSKLASDQHDSKQAWVFPLLSERRLVETDPAVIETIDFALTNNIP